MDTAPESNPPQIVSESVSAIMGLAMALATAAAMLDPQSETAYTGTAPQPDRSLANTWRENIVRWMRQGVISQATYRKAIAPLRIWYIASHRVIPTSHYYVDPGGLLYASFLRQPVNGVVEVIPLTIGLLETMPKDDANHLINEMRKQRDYQHFYLSTEDPASLEEEGTSH